MQTHYQCLPCLLRQAIDTAELSIPDEEKRRSALSEVLHILDHADFSISSPYIGQEINRVLRKISGVEDPYLVWKQQMTELAVQHYDELKRQIYLHQDPVMFAAKLAAAGSLLALQKKETAESYHNALIGLGNFEFAVDDSSRFLNELPAARRIVYFADNAGEIVFDRLFIETIMRFYPERQHQFTIVVRKTPYLHNVVQADLQAVGFSGPVRVIEADFIKPAELESNSESKLAKALDQADMIISKGQGNFELLDTASRPVYFMFKIRCPLISEQIGQSTDSVVFMRR